jgi:hypothetical protein
MTYYDWQITSLSKISYTKGVWGVFIGWVSELHHWFEAVTHQTQADCSYTWPTGHPTWPPLTLGIGYPVNRPSLTCWQSKNWNGANTWSAGPTLAWLGLGFVILSMTFRHIEDMHGFWSIWCFSVIQCSWNARSTKLIELISNKHISSISCLKYRYVGCKYMHFMTTTPRHTHT